jgi:hypothetical protein
MTDTADITHCEDAFAGNEDPLSPFYALNYHFGMLLGVDDFTTEQRYHHGKMRLHNAWLHGAGVVWGFDVKLDPGQDEIRVKPGLAWAGPGHALHLDADSCVNVVHWYLAHKDDPDFTETTTPTGVSFDARVEVRFKSCLTRQVPALLDTCTVGETGTAYSRIFETIDLRLLPGKAEKSAVLPYRRARVLFGLEEPNLPDDKPIIETFETVAKLPSEQQTAAYLEALRKLIALDAIDLQPEKSADGETQFLFPGPRDAPLVLAEITGIKLDRSGTNGKLKLAGGEVDVTVRPVHIPTRVIQELLCASLFQKIIGSHTTASGPRVLSDTVQIADNDISFQLDADLHPKSVAKEAFSVATFTDADGWKEISVTPSLTSAPPKLNLHLDTPLAADTLVRFIARGTGAKPLLGTNLAPLAGAVGGPPSPQYHGVDFVFMQARTP